MADGFVVFYWDLSNIYIYWPLERGGKRAQKTRTISSSLLLFSVEEPAAVDGSAEARNFLVLDGELVVVEDLLAWEQGLHGEEDDRPLATIDSKICTYF